uniref:Insecticidal crystal toxin domain-containing protein n=1 Tax=Lotus japonicus TaxID=34305 RepID=I3SVS3_LOTJA|nr:unknown [Lotus japonicus]
MYVTRPLSLYKKSAEALSSPPPEGPNSGILVIQDEELETTSCLGLGQYHEVKALPFPQNLNLELFYRSGISLNRSTHFHHVAFIPVLNQPLSSNKYYVIHLNGKNRGEAYINSKEEDLDTFCFYNSVSDAPLHPLDINDSHHEFEIFPRRSKVTFRSGFSAKSVAPDGYPPRFLSTRWKVSASSTSSDFNLGEASGVNDDLRASQPEFKFSLASTSSETVAVGKWYCPFMFIEEGTHRTLKDEMRKSMFYEMTLEQKWEQVFSCENDNRMGNVVNVDAVVQKEVVVIAGWEAVMDRMDVAEGLLWFNSFNNVGEKNSVGLSTAIVERMKWEQERVGWIGGKENQVRVVKSFEGTNGWKKFGCYVLVESFVVKRLDGSIALNYAFKHSHQLRSKWE